MKNIKKLPIIFAVILGFSQFCYSQTKSQKTTAIPNSFLDYKLGTKLSDFLAKNVDAIEGTFGVLHTEISANGMKVYTVKRQTSGGDKVQIDCCFYNDILSIISVEYTDGQSGKDIFNALKGKYGENTSYDSFEWKDFMNGKERTTETIYWEKTTCMLNFLYTSQLRLAELVFADKSIQQKIEAEKQKKNSKKID
jgi:hypothetical protein